MKKFFQDISILFERLSPQQVEDLIMTCTGLIVVGLTCSFLLTWGK